MMLRIWERLGWGRMTMKIVDDTSGEMPREDGGDGDGWEGRGMGSCMMIDFDVMGYDTTGS